MGTIIVRDPKIRIFKANTADALVDRFFDQLLSSAACETAAEIELELRTEDSNFPISWLGIKRIQNRCFCFLMPNPPDEILPPAFFLVDDSKTDAIPKPVCSTTISELPPGFTKIGFLETMAFHESATIPFELAIRMSKGLCKIQSLKSLAGFIHQHHLVAWEGKD